MNEETRPGYLILLLPTILLLLLGAHIIGNYEGWFESNPKKGEVWGDNPFNVDYKVIEDVKDGYVLYSYRNWKSGNHTLELSRFKRWYDKQRDK